ncbi:hypothetical protein KR222_004263 [Zaprionus bogoriensis]|nr:hypothetical protein KR222_004263 [Zaprionus bogoriensis]
MAALSYSPSSTPPPPTACSKENNKPAVTPLGGNGAHSKAFHKITVHNVLSESGANALQQHINNQNTIIRKIKDFGMLGAVQSATMASSAALPRKRPLAEIKLGQNAQQPQQQARVGGPTPGKRTKLSKKQAKQQQQQQTTTIAVEQSEQALRQQDKLAELQGVRAAGTPGRKGLPLPQAVARRNARERNRVKQVNNGFAALRDRIPDEVSEAFEAQGAGRGASKKLSKVETLRMAVEYIRSLERLLGFDFPPLRGCHNSNSSSSGDDSFMFIKDEFDALDEHFDDSLSNYELDEQPLLQLHEPEQELEPEPEPEPELEPETELERATERERERERAQTRARELELELEPELERELELPTVTMLNGLQYVRIPGTSTYQLLTPELLGAAQDSSSLDEEHFEALIDSNCLGTQPNNNVVAAATSPAAPSNGECVKFASNLSRSPQQQQQLQLQLQQQQQQQQLQHQQQQQQQQLLCSPALPAFYDQEPSASFYDNVVVGLPSFKKEFTDVLQDQSNNTASGCLSDESMIDAIDWWEAHTPKSDAGTVAGI